jgi:hypothetical protein
MRRGAVLPARREAIGSIGPVHEVEPPATPEPLVPERHLEAAGLHVQRARRLHVRVGVAPRPVVADLVRDLERDATRHPTLDLDSSRAPVERAGVERTRVVGSNIRLQPNAELEPHGVADVDDRPIVERHAHARAGAPLSPRAPPRTVRTPRRDIAHDATRTIAGSATRVSRRCARITRPSSGLPT